MNSLTSRGSIQRKRKCKTFQLIAQNERNYCNLIVGKMRSNSFTDENLLQG